MKRLAAIVAAVAMVGGAWVLRDALDGDDDGGRDTPSTLRVTCATELAAVCQTLDGQDGDVELTVEDPGRTADRIAQLPGGEDPGFDAWLADGPWAAMVADDRVFAGVDGEVLGGPSAVLARSPAVIVVQSTRSDELTEACAGTITWRCIGDRAGAFRVGLTAPDRGDGLVPLAEATAGYFGTSDYSTVDFEDPGFTTWFDQLTELSTKSQVGDQSALAAALTRAGTFGVVGALEAQSATLLRGRDGWETLYPEPMSTADVQLVPRAGLDADEVLDRIDRSILVGALTDQGWRPTSGQGDPVVAIPDDAGLPAPGVLNALRDRW